MAEQNTRAPEIVWHYTRASYMPKIEASGALVPKSEAEFACNIPMLKGMYISSVPLIWFSSDQLWEHSTSQLAAKRYQTWQQAAYEMGAVRYGISSSDDRLLDWDKTCEISGANREERRQRKKLIPHARKAGSNPALWFSCPVSIPLDELEFEMYLDGWTPVDRELMRDKLIEMGKY